MVRVAIAGIGGRMGREVLSVAQSEPDVQVTGGVVRTGCADETAASVGQEIALHVSVPELLTRDGGTPDVLIEFTNPDATLEIARACAAHRCPLVSGTTGLAPDQLDELRSLAERTPIFYARNMSVGLNAILASLPALVQALDGYDIEIVEAHHRHKADAPSGTALALAEAIAGAVHRPLANHAVYGRHGTAPRKPGDIGIHAVRGGGNAGEHAIIIADEGEEIQVRHRAYSRRTFALGALRAARFLVDQPPGWYSMEHLLIRS